MNLVVFWCMRATLNHVYILFTFKVPSLTKATFNFAPKCHQHFAKKISNKVHTAPRPTKAMYYGWLEWLLYRQRPIFFFYLSRTSTFYFITFLLVLCPGILCSTMYFLGIHLINMPENDSPPPINRCYVGVPSVLDKTDVRRFFQSIVMFRVFYTYLSSY